MNPYDEPGGISNAQSLRRGAFADCENVIEAAPVADAAIGATWIGPPGNGAHTGTDRNDTLLGAHGSDTISGGTGDDVIWGDRLHGGGGLRSTDRLDGGPGDDVVYGGRGTNRIAGGDGDDFLQGGPAANVVAGGAGDDEIRLRGRGSNQIRGGAGNDTIFAFAAGRATVDCGPGNDTVFVGRKRPHLNRVRARRRPLSRGGQGQRLTGRRQSGATRGRHSGCGGTRCRGRRCA